MIRLLTENEKSCYPSCSYMLEIHGHKIWLTPKKFERLAAEVKNLAMHHVSRSVCTCGNSEWYITEENEMRCPDCEKLSPQTDC